jgi:outer membrane protein TolC
LNPILQRKRLVALAVIFLSMATGCALTHPTDPFRPPAIHRWNVSEQPPAPPPLSLPAGPLDLPQSIRIALANNPDIAAAGWDEKSAQAQYDTAFGERLPSLKAVGGYAHYNDDQRLIPTRYNGEPGVFGDDIAAADLVLTLPLFTGGRLINQVKAADLLYKAAGQRLARSRQELTFNVSSVFFSILAQQRVVESLEFSRRVLDENIKRVDALIAAQKAAKVDRLRTEVRLADIQQRWVRERNVMAIQYRVLANLLGFAGAPNDPPSVQGELAPGPQVDIPDCETAFASARSRRGDYLAARSTLEAQARNVDAARAGHLPTVSLQGAYGERWALGGTTGPPRGGVDDSEDVGRIGVVVEIPLFEGGRVEARIRDQLSKLAAAQERLRKLELQICLETETALLNIQSSRERIDATQKAVDQAMESLRIEGLKYDAGKGAILDVLDAQSALLDSQVNYYRALTDFHTALAQLRFATGEES